jgi:UPF0755 protein
MTTSAPQHPRAIQIPPHCIGEKGGVLVMVFLALVLLAIGVSGWLALWANYPMAHRQAMSTIDFEVESGMSVKQLITQAQVAGLEVNGMMLYSLFKYSGMAREVKAGSYELDSEVSPWTFVQKLTRGEESLKSVTLIEGWTMRQWRQALNKTEGLKHESLQLSDEELMQRLGLEGQSAEGRFYPDTYTFGKSSSDLKVLSRALKSMQRHLDAAWQARDVHQVLANKDEALILASIVEKETGQAKDRPMIASVFQNRLKIGMPLQTDPTVIYGLGESFNGDLTRHDLKTDHPWNTYTRLGLPPTPIAMPGAAALFAALHPATSNALYFVAKGDGSSQFSETLAEHNEAVRKYQLHRQ